MELESAREEYGLKHVELKENGALEKFSLETNSLRTALFDYTPLVADPILDTFAKTCPDLETLSCDKCPGVAHPDLRKLFPRLVQSSLGNNLGEVLNRLQNGKLFYLAFSHLMPPAIRSLPIFTGLTTLIVENSHMSDEGATLISTLPDLNEVDLSNNSIGPEGARSLFRHSKITVLTLNGNNVGNQGLLWFNPNVTIRTLSVARNGIGNEGLYGLLASQIEDIDLSSNQITDVGANILRHMAVVNTLNLSHNRIGDSGACGISKMPHLRHLILKNCQIEPEGACWFNQCAKLIFLDFRNNNAGDNGALAISRSNSIVSLDLGRNGVTSKGVSQLSAKLKFLRLKHNMIDDEGAKILAGNETLNALSLGDNPIGEGGYLAFKTSPNDNLRMLYKHQKQENTLEALGNE
jgi:hypothetical protein